MAAWPLAPPASGTGSASASAAASGSAVALPCSVAFTSLESCSIAATSAPAPVPVYDSLAVPWVMSIRRVLVSVGSGVVTLTPISSPQVPGERAVSVSRLVLPVLSTSRDAFGLTSVPDDGLAAAARTA